MIRRHRRNLNKAASNEMAALTKKAKLMIERVYQLDPKKRDRLAIVEEVLGVVRITRPTLSRYLSGKSSNPRCKAFLIHVIEASERFIANAYKNLSL